MAGRKRQDLFLNVSGNIDPLKSAMTAGKTVLNQFGGSAINVLEEVEKEVAKIGATAPARANALEQAYSRTFSAIKANAQAALAAPTNAGAADIINAAGARQAAEAAEAKAGALRIVAEAASRADTATTGDTAANRAFAVSAAAAAVGAREEADALRAQANVLNLVEGELGQLTVAQRRATGVSGQQRAGMQQLGYQLNDVAIGFAAGTPPMIIFAQQSGQVIQALGLMTDGTKGFLSFIGGPWGIALGTAAVVLTPLVAKLFEGNDALEKATEKLKTNAAETEINRQAQERFSQTLDGRIAKQRELNTEIDRTLTSERQLSRAQVQDTANRRATAEIDLRVAQGKLQRAQGDLARAQDPRNFGTGESSFGAQQNAIRNAQARVAAARKEVKDSSELAASADKYLRDAQVRSALSAAEASADPLAKISSHWSQVRDEATAAARAVGQAGDAMRRTFAQRNGLDFGKLGTTGVFNEIARREKAEREVEQKRKRDENRKPKAAPSLGAQVDSARGSSLLESAERYRGLSERSDNAQVRDLLKQAGVNVDPKMVAWCAAFVNAVLATNGLPGTGSLAARSFLDYGSKTDTPVKGDIVVSRRGKNPAEGHVGFYQGTDAKGNVLVLGGNTGDKVGTQKVALRDVLGFRRAPTSDTKQVREQERDAKRELAEDISFVNEERQLRHKLLDQKARGASNEAERNALILEDIAAEAEGYAKRIELVQKAGKLDEAEAQRLLALNDEVKQQRERNLKIEEAARVFDRQIESQNRSLDYDIQYLRLQLDLAKTTAERKQIAAELLAAEQRQRRLALEKVRDDPASTPEAQAQAQTDLGRLPDIEQGERQQVARDNLAPIEEYRQRLEQSVGDMNEAMERVKVHGLETLEDELTAVILGTESVGDAFRKMAASIIADLVRISIQKTILGAIGGEGGGEEGGGGGLLSGGGSGILGAVFGLFGGKRERGGGVSSDQFYLVGEKGPELFAPGRTGTVIPNHVLAGATVPRVPQNVSRQSTNVQTHISIDATGADAAGLARVQSAVEQLRADLPAAIVTTVADARQRRILA